MNTRRVSLYVVVLLALASIPILAAGAVVAGPRTASRDRDLGFGTWEFTGKDKAGTVWKGTLVIEKPDRSMFESPQVIAQGNLQLEAADGRGLGALTPIQYDPATRIVTMGGESKYGGAVYTAILAPDGKTLTKGTWRETEWVSEEKKTRLASEGEWSATRIEPGVITWLSRL
jgi:hypothetical protein